MNIQKLSRAKNVRVLKIHALGQEEGQAIPVAIKFVRSGWPGNSRLAAELDRLRCGQEALEMAAPAPREIELAHATS